MSQGLGASFDAAQRAYDDREPPEEHDCKTDGHRLKLRRVARIGGEDVEEFKCVFCPHTEII